MILINAFISFHLWPVPKNIHAFIINNETTLTLNKDDQPQPTKFGKKKPFSHILFSWETTSEKKEY